MRRLRRHPEARGVAHRHVVGDRPRHYTLLCPIQLTGNDEAKPAEHPAVLWDVLKFIDEVTSEIVLGRQPRSDQARSMFRELQRQEEAKVTVGMVLLATVEVGALFDPSLRRSGWLKRPGGSTAPASGGFTENEVQVEIGGSAEGTETDSTRPEVSLWAIREALNLTEMFVSTAARPRGLALELVDQRIRELRGDNLHRVRAAVRLVRSACATVLWALQDASEEAGKTNWGEEELR